MLKKITKSEYMVISYALNETLEYNYIVGTLVSVRLWNFKDGGS